MRTVLVTTALKELQGTFLAKEIPVARDVESRPNRYGHTTWTKKMIVVTAVNFQGLALLELKTIVTLLKVFKQTGVKTIHVSAHDGGIRIAFDRAFYYLKGIGA